MSRRLRNANRLHRSFIWIVLVCLASGATAAPTLDPQRTRVLSELPLEELLQVPVVTLLRKPQTVAEAPAAVHVITGEEIRRAGHTTIAEALRMVPGMQVAQIDANKWAVTSRGFNHRFANKLLVLMDGRSVYTPLFSGVHWDVQDTLLEDIDRIEVVRGPGGTLWGANAVNGVVNIVTKEAAETQGGLAVAGTGTRETGTAGVRYGGRLGDSAHYRVYAKYFDRRAYADPHEPPNPVTPVADGFPPPDIDAADGWNAARAGFRVDWDASSSDRVTIQGDFYGGSSGSTITTDYLHVAFQPLAGVPNLLDAFADDTALRGGNLRTRWSRSFSEGSELSLQVYYDRTEREDALLGETRDTADVDFQHRFRLHPRLETVWGAGYRFTRDSIENSLELAFDPSRRSDHLLSGFFQNEVDLVPDTLRFTFGSKIEWNTSTGFEYQPSVRLWWRPESDLTLWASASRAVRTPSRLEQDATLQNFQTSIGFGGTCCLMLRTLGNDDLRSQELLAFELGLRAELLSTLSLDLALFESRYSNLFTSEAAACSTGVLLYGFCTELVPPPLGGVFVFTTNGRIVNGQKARTRGAELALEWQPVERWRFSAAYTWYQISGPDDPVLGQAFVAVGGILVPIAPIQGEFTGTLASASSPSHQIHLRSQLDLPYDIEFDAAVYLVSALPRRRAKFLPDQNVAGYARLDVRLGWQPWSGVELSLVGQNLLQNRHSEFGASDGIFGSDVPRSGHARMTWRF